VIKKRAMSMSKFATDFMGEYSIEFHVEKRIETGYANTQPKYPYWVKPLNYSADEWLDMSDWITETMGESDWSSANTRCIGSNQKLWFRDERDRTMFLLKWS